jgi:hypothetical protein
MNEVDPAIANTRRAIEFLTVWMDQDRVDAPAYIERVLNDPNESGARNIIAGQCNLSMVLVLALAKERGAVTAEELWMKVGEILQELPQYFPE